MALGIRTPGLKLVWEADGLEIDLLPLQGLWTEEQYLRLTDQTNRLIEFTEGSVEILPLPTRKHQAISRYLFLALLAFVERIGGTVFYAPLRVRVAPNRFREPDLGDFSKRISLIMVQKLDGSEYPTWAMQDGVPNGSRSPA
jgi:Uma2 family endonuclease